MLAVDRDTTLDCDAVVVGSGAGGGVVAGLLAAAGRSVVVLEKGPNPGRRDMTQVEGDMLGALYLDGGLLMTQSGSMPSWPGAASGAARSSTTPPASRSRTKRGGSGTRRAGWRCSPARNSRRRSGA